MWHKYRDFEYNPFWQEAEGISDSDLAYNQGFDQGYIEALKRWGEEAHNIAKLERENEALRGILGAEIRIKRKENAPDTNVNT